MPNIIGITGGIGAGKSLVCSIFSTLGIPIYQADYRAKWLCNHNVSLKNDIVTLLGADAYLSNGDYNRVWVASKVFNDKALLTQLNALIHPCVHHDAQQWITQYADAPFLLYEAALMKAAGDHNIFQKVIVVNASIDLRIKRVKQRDGRSEEEIRAIMARQISDVERNQLADYTIYNDDSHPVIAQVLALYDLLCQLP